MSLFRFDKSFFRQSGWMLFASTAAGALFAVVQIVAQRMPETESQQYALFSALMEGLGQLAIPALGRSPALMTEGRDEDEWRKRITAVLSRGPSFVVLDNIRNTLDSAALGKQPL